MTNKSNSICRFKGCKTTASYNYSESKAKNLDTHSNNKLLINNSIIVGCKIKSSFNYSESKGVR